MNKFNKAILSILAGMDALFYIITPLLVSILWISFTGLSQWLFYTIGICAMIFRAIKVGWMK